MLDRWFVAVALETAYFLFFFYSFFFHNCDIIETNKDTHLLNRFREKVFADGSSTLVLPSGIGWQCAWKQSSFILAT